MPTIKLRIEVTYDDFVHGNSPEELGWFFTEVLDDKVGLLLHSNKLGDTVGTVNVLEVL